jgi:hypothetical protein
MAPNPVLLICGCRKYEEYLHAAIRRMTRPEWTVIGILGGGAVTGFDEVTRVLTLAVPDTYETLPTKIHAACTWIYENHPGIPGIFKTDDDMLFDIPALVAAVATHAAKPYWGIVKGMCHAAPVNPLRIAHRFVDTTLKPSHQSAIYCYGGGYWLSAAVLPIVVAAASTYASSSLEDVCTGFVLNSAKIFPDKIAVPSQEGIRGPQLLALQ